MVIAVELLIHRGALQWSPWGLIILAWGYAQYRLSGRYRTAHGGGGPGIDVPPDRIVDTGIYAYTRNPMYLGHLIFMIGLVITFHSALAALLVVFHIFWYQQRVLEDEKHLAILFGDAFQAYVGGVKRWIPGRL